MKLVKLINALPQSAPGNRELHFGQMCEIRGDGIYCEIEDGLADLFVMSNRAKIVEDVKAVKIEPVIETVTDISTSVPEISTTVAETSTVVAEEAIENDITLGFGSYQEETVATPEPETIVSKTAGKRGPKAKGI